MSWLEGLEWSQVGLDSGQVWAVLVVGPFLLGLPSLYCSFRFLLGGNGNTVADGTL